MNNLPSRTASTFRWMLAVCLFQLPAVAPGQDFPIIDDDEQLVAAAAVEPNAGLGFLNEGNTPTSIEQLREMEQVFAEIAELVTPATVNITLAEAQGSGVVVSRDGYVLTAAHVISRPNLKATVTFPDGTQAEAMTLGIHRSFDSGMLKITDKGKWPSLEIGESEPLVKGQWVMAIGHPGGLTEGRGLVFRAGRVLSKFPGYISTDCTLVGGDSGGPLVDLNGNVVGIHSRIGAQLTENFHVPIDIFSKDWDQMADGVIVDSDTAFLGIDLKRDGRNITNEVSRVTENESADKAGVKAGDVILAIGDAEIKTGRDLQQILRKADPGDEIVIRVRRDGEELELDATLGYR